MLRQKGLSRVYATVSVAAILGLMAGCSQPASYATVDLGGSYVNSPPQAYSAQSGLPVYQSTQVYTTPYSVASAQPLPQSQLVYQDAPLNQVASLNYGGYGQSVQQSYPTFGALDQGPILTDETILRSDGFIDMGPYGGAQTAMLAPGAGSIGYEQMSVVSDVPQYLPAPQPAAPIYEAAPMAYSEPVYEAAPLAYSAPVIAEALPAPYSVAPVQGINEGYATLSSDDFGVPQASPSYTAIESVPLGTVPVAPRAYASLSGQPQRDDTQAVVDYFQLNRDRQDGAVQQARLPVTELAPAPAAPIAAFDAPNGQGIALPPASQEYPRPYEALPPGFFPEYEFPSGNGLISQADPVAAPAPVQVATLAPRRTVTDAFNGNGVLEAPSVPMIEQASSSTFSGQSYTIRPGDTLYGIARMFGVTPMGIAKANALPMAGTIYPGDVLNIPAGEVGGRPETLGDAPIVVLQTADAASISTFTRDLTDQSVEMIDIEDLARMFRERENGDAGASMPIISAEAGNALRGRPDLSPTEIISEPVGTVTAPAFVTMQELPASTPMAQGRGSYGWPIHGDVYRLNGGGIEIGAPAGQAVVAAAGGRVVHVENGPRGVLVVVEHDDGWRSLTIGLSDAIVLNGQRVSGGDTLGYSGSQRIGFELRDTSSNVAETLGVLRG